MKRNSTSGAAQPIKQYFIGRLHLPDLPLDVTTDSFLSRFDPSASISQRKYCHMSIPKLIVSEKVRIPLPQNTHSSESMQDNAYHSLTSSYSDLVLISPDQDQRMAMRIAYVHQAVSHVVKTQALLASGEETKPRDQGFTQATVLILVPYKRFALEIVQQLIEVHCKGRAKRVSKKSRKKFDDEYTNSEDLQFGDDFKLGLSLAPRHNMFLYTPFKLSDIIIASPLALSALLTEDPAASSALSSIEVMVVDEAGIMLMQNWDHLEVIWEKVNLMPQRDFVTADIERVREYWLDQRGAEYRQNIVLSDIMTPEINGLIGSSQNHLGWIKVAPAYTGALVPGKLHRLRKFDCTPELVNEQRFQYFTQEFWVKIRDVLPSPAVVFCSSYFEFVRLKNWFENEEPGIVAISEYTSKPDRQRYLSYLHNDSSKAVLLTERLVYFRHVHVKAAKALVLYSLPLHPHIYEEMTTNMAGEEVWMVFCALDALNLQRILGDAKAQQLVTSKGSNFSVNATS
jgi:U3 small nucleolar RNA-associated protein 25